MPEYLRHELFIAICGTKVFAVNEKPFCHIELCLFLPQSKRVTGCSNNDYWRFVIIALVINITVSK